MKRRLIRLAVVTAALLVVLAVPAPGEQICSTSYFCHTWGCGLFFAGAGYSIEICFDPDTGRTTEKVTFLGCGC